MSTLFIINIISYKLQNATSTKVIEREKKEKATVSDHLTMVCVATATFVQITLIKCSTVLFKDEFFDSEGRTVAQRSGPTG